MAALAIATGWGGWGVRPACAYTAPYSTPPGITLVDVSKTMDEATPQYLWRRLGDAHGNPLYTYDADPRGRSSCYGECARQFPPFAADTRARAAGDFSIIVRDDRVRQWTYQGKPLYRYSGKDPYGEPTGGRFVLQENPAWHDPASDVYSPRRGWRRAAYAPEASTVMPPNVELDGLAIADGFGFVEAATHVTIYAAPVSHRLSSEWRPLRASALALPVGEFSIITRRDDGARQWAYRGEALYTYAGDYAPGEVTGLFVGDPRVQAALAYRNFIPPGVEIDHFPLRGPLMTDSKGLTLYSVARYHQQYGGRETRAGYSITYNDAKSQGTEGCLAECTVTWRPLLAPGNARPWGFWEPIMRPDGTRQWAFKGSPVYTYIGDHKPGDIEGNNRNVIMFGGSRGQIVYADAGTDPRDPRPLLGKNITMQIAYQGAGAGDANAPDAVGAGSLAGAAAADDTARSAVAERASSPRAAGSRAQASKGVEADADGMRGGLREQFGAGFYWHTIGLFY